MMRIRPLDPVIGKYLAYWMRTTIFQSLIHSNKVLGKGLQNIYPYLVSTMPVPCPYTYDYKRIVENIDRLFLINEELRRSTMDQVGQIQTYLDNEMGFAKLKDEFDAQEICKPIDLQKICRGDNIIYRLYISGWKSMIDPSRDMG